MYIGVGCLGVTLYGDIALHCRHGRINTNRWEMLKNVRRCRRKNDETVLTRHINSQRWRVEMHGI